MYIYNGRGALNCMSSFSEEHLAVDSPARRALRSGRIVLCAYCKNIAGSFGEFFLYLGSRSPRGHKNGRSAEEFAGPPLGAERPEKPSVPARCADKQRVQNNRLFVRRAPPGPRPAQGGRAGPGPLNGGAGGGGGGA